MSIFAKQLQYVLKQHGKHLGSLYNIRVEDNGYDGRFISPGNIQRLKQITQGKKNGTVMLSRYELEAVQRAFSFSPDEIMRLRAALAAESVLRFLLDRLEPEKASMVGDMVFQLLYDADDSTFLLLRNRIINHTRGDTIEPDDDAPIEVDALRELEPVFELYEYALLWLETARAMQNTFLREGYLAMTRSLINNAQKLVYASSNLAKRTSLVVGLLSALSWLAAEVDASQGK